MTCNFLFGFPLCLIAVLLWAILHAYYWLAPYAVGAAINYDMNREAAALGLVGLLTVSGGPYFIFAVMHVLYGIQILLSYISIGLSAAAGALLGGVVILAAICLFTIAIPLFCPIIALIFAFLTQKAIIMVGASFSMVFPFLYIGFRYHSKKAASGESDDFFARLKR